jgi:dihydroorotate dehydrogenase (fumarate)
MTDISVNYVGKKLKSPIIIAASALTETVERVKKAEQFGAGGVVVKTKFEEPMMAKSPTPRFSVLSHGFVGDRSLSFYSIEQGAEVDIDGYCEEIIRMKEQTDIAIIGSVGCVNDETWVSWSKAVERAGADVLELNLSCPHSNLVIGNAPVITETIDHVTRLVKKSVSLPVISKMTPQMNSPLAAAHIIEAAGGDGLCAFSRFLGLDLDIETQVPIMHGGYGGHGGPWSINYALRWISVMYPAIKIPISGCGGVTKWQDVIKYFLVGANNVQVCAAVYMRGYEVVETLVSGLKKYMEKHGYSSIDNFRGNTVPRIKQLSEYNREQVVVANISEDKCKACGSCAKSCIYFAIETDNAGTTRVNDKCAGCGLCEQLCPSKAIHMVAKA